jgi:phosphoribosyl 1,2-cyclic phosphodiesterase
MEVTFYGVRGSIPSPGPATVRYGGNTACVAVNLGAGELVILDCGTGARNLGINLRRGPFGQGQGRAAILLSHTHWDHIQGFPFFLPFYIPGNEFTVYGAGDASARLDEILEVQMAAQYFPVQSFRNMGATLHMRAAPEGEPFVVGAARVTTCANPHGRSRSLAFRIEHGGKALVYASDAGYGDAGPSRQALRLYAGADLLIHDCTFTPEDRAARKSRGLASLDDAVAAAVAAKVKKLALIHYDQDYSDPDVDRLVARGRRELDDRGATRIEIVGAAEGATLTL